jgi:hypothetical protein
MGTHSPTRASAIVRSKLTWRLSVAQIDWGKVRMFRPTGEVADPATLERLRELGYAE